MWGRVGALCLSSSGCDPFASRNTDESCCDEDKHKAPASAQHRPLSLQDDGDDGDVEGRSLDRQDSRFRSLSIIRLPLEFIKMVANLEIGVLFREGFFFGAADGQVGAAHEVAHGLHEELVVF